MGALDAQVGGVTLSHDVQGRPRPWETIKPSHLRVMDIRQNQLENLALAFGRAVAMRFGLFTPFIGCRLFTTTDVHVIIFFFYCSAGASLFYPRGRVS